MNRNKRIILLAIGAMAGAIIGYFYWKWIGCSSGSCLITSKPLNSTLYFALIGMLVINVFLPSTGTGKKQSSR